MIFKTSLNPRWTVYDHMIFWNINVSEFAVKKELVQSCKAAHSKYTAHLNETKKEKVKEKEGNKRKCLRIGKTYLTMYLKILELKSKLWVATLC